MTQPDDVPKGLWIWVPVYSDPETVSILKAVNDKLGAIMAQVQVDAQALIDLDAALDSVAQSLSEKIAALNLPQGDLQPLLDDVEALRGLSAPAPEETA